MTASDGPPFVSAPPRTWIRVDDPPRGASLLTQALVEVLAELHRRPLDTLPELHDVDATWWPDDDDGRVVVVTVLLRRARPGPAHTLALWAEQLDEPALVRLASKAHPERHEGLAVAGRLAGHRIRMCCGSVERDRYPADLHELRRLAATEGTR